MQKEYQELGKNFTIWLTSRNFFANIEVKKNVLFPIVRGVGQECFQNWKNSSKWFILTDSFGDLTEEKYKYSVGIRHEIKKISFERKGQSNLIPLMRLGETWLIKWWEKRERHFAISLTSFHWIIHW